jgi:hypothetical protein
MIGEIFHADFAECLNEKFIGNDFIDFGFVESIKNRVFFVCIDPGRGNPLQMSLGHGLKHPWILHYLTGIRHLKLSTLSINSFRVKKFDQTLLM